MAVVIPENLQTNKAISAAHRRIGKALNVGLDESAAVWFEPPFEPEDDRQRPDFVVLDPSIGLVAVDVFEQADGQEVLGAVRGEIRLVEAGGEVAVENPLARAESFAALLAEELAKEVALSRVPVGSVAAFPYLSRSQAELLGLDSVVAMDRCLFSGEVSSIVGDDGTVSLPRFLTRVLEGGVEDLIEDDVQEQLRGLIHPEIVIDAPLEQGALFVPSPQDDGGSLRVMDLHQERFAKRLNAGHRVIHGVAGSGKTLVLVTRARLMSRMFPSRRVLATCYTKSLASVLKAQLADCSNVDVRTLDAVAAELIKAGGLQHPGWKGPNSPWAVALQAIERRPPQRYRAVLVDEAQDLDNDGLQLCVALAEPGADGMGDLLVVADQTQHLYDRSFTWSAAGIQARGRTSVLRFNYRNTREVLEFASAFVAADAENDDVMVEIDVAARDDLDLDDEMLIVPPEATERHGEAPAVHLAADNDAAIEQILDEVERWYSPSLPARSIAVLMKTTKNGLVERLAAGLDERGLPFFWATESAASKERVGMVEDSIVLSTIHSAKGLEFPNVVVCGLGQRETGEAAVRNRNLLYVGFTRAIDRLSVVTTTANHYAATLEDLSSS